MLWLYTGGESGAEGSELPVRQGEAGSGAAAQREGIAGAGLPRPD